MDTASLPAAHLRANPRFAFDRVGPLGVIILLHAGLLYGLRGGQQHPATPSAPREVVATFVAPSPSAAPVPAIAPEPPKPPPASKKAALPPRKTAAPSKRAAPVADSAPVQPAAASSGSSAAPAEASPPVAATAAAPATATPPAQPKTVTSGIQYLQPPQPDYPLLAKRMGEEGKAVLRVLVDGMGRPQHIELQKSSGSARLDEAARQAVLHARFKPFIEDGNPVAAYAIVPINFQLAS